MPKRVVVWGTGFVGKLVIAWATMITRRRRPAQSPASRPRKPRRMMATRASTAPACVK